MIESFIHLGKFVVWVIFAEYQEIPINEKKPNKTEQAKYNKKRNNK